MRKQWAALIGLAALTACSSVTDPYSDLLITVAVSENIVNASAPAVITTTVTNTGDWSLKLDTGKCGGPRFIVRSANGTEIIPITVACRSSNIRTRLGPGKQHSFVSSWNGRAGSGHAIDGEYEVFGTPYGVNGPRSAAARVIVRNPPI